MREVVIVDGVRTAIARSGQDRSFFRDVRGDELAARCLRALLDRNPKVSTDIIEDVILGCANQSGEQGLNLGRMVALLAGFPVEVAGTTVDRQCGSGLQAVNFGAQAIAVGAAECVLTGGVEHMTHVPMGSTVSPNPRLLETFSPEIYLMGMTAERLAALHGITRSESDTFALRSHQHALNARSRFAEEIVPIALQDGKVADVDQGPRADTTLERLAALKPSFKPDGQVTAGNSSQVSDGAAALLLMSAECARSLGRAPLARILATAVAGVSPELMGWGPVPATRKALASAGLQISDLDLVEINEAFAAQVLACNRDLRIDEARLNVNGGAVALGHPLGCSGARLMVTLVHEMRRRHTRLGLVSMCIGLGQGIATIVEQV